MAAPMMIGESTESIPEKNPATEERFVIIYKTVKMIAQEIENVMNFFLFSTLNIVPPKIKN